MENKWEHNATDEHMVIDFQKEHDSMKTDK